MMYQVERCSRSVLKEIEKTTDSNTVFSTYGWISFLEKNQHGKPVVLVLRQESYVAAYFVGMVVQKGGVRILGSPFEGWLTPDMGLIRCQPIDLNVALKEIASYAFRELHCWFVQIADKSIQILDLASDVYYEKTELLHLDLTPPLEKILEGFTKNGRRDVRAFDRKGAVVERVPFDRAFADIYYKQLMDVFAKQELKPFYSVEKVYDLVDAFASYPERVLALAAKLPDGTCIATVFSFGFGKWAYYMGAASFREYQSYLPNEGLFWAFVKHWKEQGMTDLDLVGYRKYKMKYNPELVETPVIIFQRFPGLLWMKHTARAVVAQLRSVRGKISKKGGEKSRE